MRHSVFLLGSEAMRRWRGAGDKRTESLSKKEPGLKRGGSWRMERRRWLGRMGHSRQGLCLHSS